MGDERGGFTTGWQRDHLSSLLLKHSRRNVRTVALRATRWAFSPIIVVFTAVRTLLAHARYRVPRVDRGMRNSGELKQQHGGEDSQRLGPKRPDVGAAADTGLGAEQSVLRSFGVRSTVVHGEDLSPTAAVSQA